MPIYRRLSPTCRRRWVSGASGMSGVSRGAPYSQRFTARPIAHVCLLRQIGTTMPPWTVWMEWCKAWPSFWAGGVRPLETMRLSPVILWGQRSALPGPLERIRSSPPGGHAPCRQAGVRSKAVPAGGFATCRRPDPGHKANARRHQGCPALSVGGAAAAALFRRGRQRPRA